MSCRYDRESKAHLTREHKADCVDRLCKGCQPCTRDDAGNPVRHCRTRQRCVSHLGWTEHTCPECLGKIRANLTAILDNLALMPAEAIERGINSEPANLAGPHADYVSFNWRMLNADRNGEPTEDLDMLDPYTCLTFYERTIREDLGHDTETLVSPTIAASAGYLAWVLTDLARLEEGTITLGGLIGATAELRVHMETALRNGTTPERGAPCPTCVIDSAARRAAGEDAPGPERLARIYGHWCTRSGCERIHYLDDAGDVWRCPTNPTHEWTHAAYTNYVETRTARVAS